MKISAFGTGYVGLVTGVCFAEMGNDVTCVDIDEKKIARLQEGISPIYEPNLDEMISRNIKSKRLMFTTDLKQAVQSAKILMVAVGTPSSADGSADMSAVWSVAQSIAQYMNEDKFILVKSTVPVGTHARIAEILQKGLSEKGSSYNFTLISNPEFLREGNAIEDCMRPDRIIVGCKTEEAREVMRRLYQPFIAERGHIVFMDLPSAEMTKYAANCMLATKISLMNEFSRLCERVGADIDAVRKGIGSDHRIGPHFIQAGIGYGGSCFPKDVKAMIKFGEENKDRLSILEAVDHTNQVQRSRFIEKILAKVSSGTLALWGVAFKPGTDDIREAPAIDLISACLNKGISVIAYDPAAEENTKKQFSNSEKIKFVKDQYDALKNAEALVIMTEWKSFREPDMSRIKSLLKNPRVFDGRNIYRTDDMARMGFEYVSIGRPAKDLER